MPQLTPEDVLDFVEAADKEGRKDYLVTYNEYTEMIEGPKEEEEVRWMGGWVDEWMDVWMDV